MEPFHFLEPPHPLELFDVLGPVADLSRLWTRPAGRPSGGLTPARKGEDYFELFWGLIAAVAGIWPGFGPINR
jgi:hypothetical protein